MTAPETILNKSTGPILHHHGDPCFRCGVEHDNVSSGPCLGEATFCCVCGSPKVTLSHGIDTDAGFVCSLECNNKRVSPWFSKRVQVVEADAHVAAAFEAAARAVDTLGDSVAAEALRTRLCCNGQVCGCQGATVDMYVMRQIRALTPPDAQAAMQTIIDAAERRGMQQAIHAIDANISPCVPPSGWADDERHAYLRGQIDASVWFVDAIQAAYAKIGGAS